jgi:hypothetical protein
MERAKRGGDETPSVEQIAGVGQRDTARLPRAPTWSAALTTASAWTSAPSSTPAASATWAAVGAWALDVRLPSEVVDATR